MTVAIVLFEIVKTEKWDTLFGGENMQSSI